MKMTTETAVMIYGRFQPPTKAHAELFDKLLEIAFSTKEPTSGYIFISPKVDRKTNPLSWFTRYNFLCKLYPDIDFVDHSDIKDPFGAVHFLGGLGHKHIIVIAGSDQAGRLDKQQIGRASCRERVEISVVAV